MFLIKKIISLNLSNNRSTVIDRFAYDKMCILFTLWQYILLTHNHHNAELRGTHQRLPAVQSARGAGRSTGTDTNYKTIQGGSSAPTAVQRRSNCG